MHQRFSRPNTLRVLAFIAGSLVVWVIAAFQLNAATGGEFGLPFGLSSHLGADYGADVAGNRIRSLRLSIVQEVLQDLGLLPDEAAGQGDDFQLALLAPVPTATARDFEGAAPYTATSEPTVAFNSTQPTSTYTFTPTATPSATSTASLTPSPSATQTLVPTATKTKTPAPSPVKTKSGDDNDTNGDDPIPSLTPAITPQIDDQVPEIKDGYAYTPAEGTVSCETHFYISQLRVKDPAYSSGMQSVGLYIKLPGFIDEWTYLEELTLYDGGPTGEGGWDGYYQGDYTFVAAEYAALGLGGVMTTGESYTDLKFKIYAEDNAGNVDGEFIVAFQVPSSCFE